MPLASEWTEEKNACIDWSIPSEVLGNGFTFLQLLAVHPRLREHYAKAERREKRAAATAIFLRGSDTEKTALLNEWRAQQLLTPREQRWCRFCGASGHTRLRCPKRRREASDEGHAGEESAEKVVPPQKGAETSTSALVFPAAADVADSAATPSVLKKYLEHRQRVERRRIMEERQRPRAELTAVRRDNASNGATAAPAGASAAAAAVFAAEDRRRGLVCRIDEASNIGFITVAGMGELKFFVDRVDVGVKMVAVGDAVAFKLDASRDYPIAVDVRHERPVISLDDVRKFLHRCRAARHPIKVMATLLMHAHEWVVLLLWLQAMREQDVNFYLDAVHTLIELTTFVGNREPIHEPVLEAFLSLMCTTTANTASSAAASPLSSSPASPAPSGASTNTESQRLRFYPDMVQDALEMSAASLRSSTPTLSATASPAARLAEDHWMEAAQYVILMQYYGSSRDDSEGGAGGNASVNASPLAEEREEAVVQLLQTVLAERAARATVVAARRLKSMQRRLAEETRRLVAVTERPPRSAALPLIPTAAELSVPPPDPSSVFAASNLPVNGAVTYDSTDRFIRDQRALLRADTFEAVSRLLPAVCYSLPTYTPSAETLSDVQHARVYSHVRCVGKVLTRDRDYSHPNSYLLEVHPHSAKADLRAQLHQGTTVCISTGLDPTRMQKDELFWGLVSSCDATLMKAGVIVVCPCEGSESFERMCAALVRNAAAGRLDRSFLLETPIFMTGYESIMRALEAFCGSLAMPLPLVRQLVGPQAATAAAAAKAAAADALAVGAVASSGHQSVQEEKGEGQLMEYIPPHCAVAFHEIANEIQSRFALDEGQAAVMRQLPVSKMILVQGPPGTGKSFIGCRVVEAYVRYKQLVASGDILQKVSINMLRSIRMDELLPRVGPMVVITYKNHALDEFLLDLLDSGLWEGDRPRVGQQLAANTAGLSSNPGTFPGGKRLVRIGGRSRESALDGYNLGSLMHGSTDRAAINSLKERLYVLNQRLERLTKEIHYLENGKVPRVYFERWLTAEQRKHITYDEREAWLAGERFVGVPDGPTDAVSATHYQELLQTRMSALLHGQETAATGAAAATAAATTAPHRSTNADAAAAAETEKDDETAVDAALQADEAAEREKEEDVSLSVFQEMRREEERREFNNELHRTYLSSEAIRLASHPPSRPAGVPEELLSLWSLRPRLRHEYYAYLIARTISAKARDCQTIMETMKSVIRVRLHATDELKLALLQGADVVGLTTTGCAMNQHLLRSLRPSVLVVEEAAEVLESQLLACMTDSLKQIILIGDHFQLQPKVDTFQYEKVNHLNLSLFERLARTWQPIRLTEQRRMHPDISRLIRPFYTPQPLIDHASLLTRPFPSASHTVRLDTVPGLAQRVFFWRHNHPEEEAPGSRSKVNTREIRMVQQVVAHLASQGVLQKSMTVITPYLGQCRMLRGVLRLRSLADVRVSTVDLYQGDENDVVILSLVRTEKLTDFIRTRNRLIVSCSRARFAMVMVGNDKLLRQCSHWQAVLDQLQADNHIGESLPITFREHPAQVQYLRVTENVSAAALEEEMNAARRPPAVSRHNINAAAAEGDGTDGGDNEVNSGEGDRDDGAGGEAVVVDQGGDGSSGTDEEA
ncbi:hypothetical protein ABB37_04800 [Leptomonas pyrrhocoris]|uniref:Uncharacterized protein n=1 Tax=Leptomonas pyrrhocoris TaxID=157538 RepID=A0A0N0DVU0_LEPPY|nr:hypothetical protein ABB37_04800 [Leptomonas pyrrhocoris]KPA80604.1 hypothetical protein ABB37_04800 [Leptomonas pyrrhocoris]|eukprot:XP_015659043.1 hypothetical protein ABB37_04800 [Leptomonas pyrrhocoris]